MLTSHFENVAYNPEVSPEGLIAASAYAGWVLVWRKVHWHPLLHAALMQGLASLSVRTDKARAA